MNAALALFTVALLGAESHPGSNPLPIQYRVKLLEMDGLSWRESLYSRLQPIARQGTCTIWTAGRDVTQPLTERASRVLMSPQLMADPDVAASYAQKTTRKVASQLTRHADGPVDHAVSVAYTTNHEDLREGCQFTMAGRQLDQGMLVKLVVEEQRVAAVHKVRLTEFVPKADNGGEKVTLNPQLDVPEVVRATLEGEWMIPSNGVLVASLGAHTLDDGHGKAVVRERLLVVEAGAVPPRATVDLSQVNNRSFTFVAPVPAAAIPLPARLPETPSRSLPVGRNAEGVPVPLPPLPESQVPPSLIPGTSEPCATPQTAPQRKGASESDSTPPASEQDETKSIDRESLKASFQPVETTPELPAVSPRPFRLRLPLVPGVEIEISAKVAPSTD